MAIFPGSGNGQNRSLLTGVPTDPARSCLCAEQEEGQGLGLGGWGRGSNQDPRGAPGQAHSLSQSRKQPWHAVKMKNGSYCSINFWPSTQGQRHEERKKKGHSEAKRCTLEGFTLTLKTFVPFFSWSRCFSPIFSSPGFPWIPVKGGRPVLIIYRDAALLLFGVHLLFP